MLKIIRDKKIERNHKLKLYNKIKTTGDREGGFKSKRNIAKQGDQNAYIVKHIM